MFSILLNTCAIPDGFVTFGDSSPKCSKCHGYTSQAVYYPPPSISSNAASPSQSPKVVNNPSTSSHHLLSSGLPDIVVSHSNSNVMRSVSHLRDDQRVTNRRERAPSASFRRLSQEETPISQRTSARLVNAISRKQCQSLSRRKEFRPNQEEERIGISPIGLESTCLESCCNGGSSPLAVNQIDYVNVGFNLRLIADSFQSESSSRTLRSGKIKLIIREKLSSNLYIKCLGISVLGFVVLSIMRSS